MAILLRNGVKNSTVNNKSVSSLRFFRKQRKSEELEKVCRSYLVYLQAKKGHGHFRPVRLGLKWVLGISGLRDLRS